MSFGVRGIGLGFSGVHLHHLLVDGGVDHHPRAPAELAVGREVDEHRVLVLAERVDDLGAELEDFVRHVARPAREAAPVCEDDEGEVLAWFGVEDSGFRVESLGFGIQGLGVSDFGYRVQGVECWSVGIFSQRWLWGAGCRVQGAGC